MAMIKCQFHTQEWEEGGGRKSGCWELVIVAGLNEPADDVLKEASDRLKTALKAIPEDKKYTRFGNHASAEGSTQ
jgi:hypothetical protein